MVMSELFLKILKTEPFIKNLLSIFWLQIQFYIENLGKRNVMYSISIISKNLGRIIILLYGSIVIGVCHSQHIKKSRK